MPRQPKAWASLGDTTMSDASGDDMVHHPGDADGGSSVDDVEDAICEECEDREDEVSVAGNDDDNENLLNPDFDDSALFDMPFPGTPLAPEGSVDATTVDSATGSNSAEEEQDSVSSSSDTSDGVSRCEEGPPQASDAPIRQTNAFVQVTPCARLCYFSLPRARPSALCFHEHRSRCETGWQRRAGQAHRTPHGSCVGSSPRRTRFPEQGGTCHMPAFR